MPSPYDAVADHYDEHFRRPVDEWEDERLVELLRPYVDGKSVLDLGCGTGWLLDHLEPSSYLGLDASAAMLEELRRKHPSAHTMEVEVGTPDWASCLVGWEGAPIEVVTATWAAHDLGDLGTLMRELAYWVGGVDVLLHGSSPRYASREHYVLDGTDRAKGYLHFTPQACQLASVRSSAVLVSLVGVGALPDRLARSRLLWRAGLLAPVDYHYSFVAYFRLGARQSKPRR